MIEILGQVKQLLEITGPALLFYGMAGLIILSAAYAVVAKKIDHSAFSLMACFTGVAAIYALLGSDFVAVTQIVVYVGGIMILIVFGVLLTDRLPLEFKTVTRENVVNGLFVAVPTFMALAWAAIGTDWNTITPGAPEPTTKGIGTLLLTDYLFPFELASVVLLVALIGAARLARGGAKAS
ncbi:MAG: NADH-quinone oxidoreductase subunit J family protein [Planctomycetota bacterium]